MNGGTPAPYPRPVDVTERAELEQRLVEVRERLDRIGLRLAAGYGSESDREGWLLWIRQLETQRERLDAALASQ
jgi:hypothetical protein